MPSIRQEIKLELQTLKASIDLPDLLTHRRNTQQFLSNKYDTVEQTLQNVKEQMTKLDKKYKEATGSLETKQTNMANMADKNRLYIESIVHLTKLNKTPQTWRETLRETLFRCKFWSMFHVFRLAWST